MSLPAHQPRKRFGQNFLRDSSIIARIVSAINPSPTDHLVEIGPGQGAMTVPLLKRAEKMHAIELDRDLIAPLQSQCAPVGALTLIQADVLQVDFRALSQQLGGPLRVAGNLPYNISTPLLFHLMEQLSCVQDMHFMLQKEVVDRMGATPGGKEYGRLSVMLQAQCAISALFDVAPSCFHPAPKVWSSIVRLVPHAVQPSAADLAGLAHVVRAAFSARRKTLSNALKGTLSVEQIRAADVDPSARAEVLSQAQYWRLVAQLHSN